MPRRYLLAGFALALALFTRPRRGLRVVAVGDSITANGKYLAAALEGLPESVGRAFGLGGRGAARIRREALPRALAYNPTDVVILAGVNALASNRSPQTIVTELRRMYQAARNAGARVLAVQVTPWAGYRKSTELLQQRTRELNRLIASSVGVQVLNTSFLGDASGRLLEGFTRDNLHLNRAGERSLGAAIARAIR